MMSRCVSLAALLACAHSTAAVALPLDSKIPTTPIGEGSAIIQMPLQGLGTWQYNESFAYEAVLAALKMGYVHIDCALGYDNQEGVARAIKDSGRKRDSFFITTKIPGGLNTSATTAALELALKQLGLDYVDLMLVHFPASWSNVGGKAGRVEEWKAMEKFYKAGKAKALGVSHYCERHVDDILEVATVKPAVNQVQFHVGMGQAGLNATDMSFPGKYKGVLYQSFSPLCGPCGTTELIDGPLVSNIGKKHGKSGAQVSLRWQVQQGIPVIPKAHNPSYIKENMEIFDWTLSDADMKALTDAKSPPVAGAVVNGVDVSTDCSVP